MKEIEIEGKNIEEAVKKGLAQLSVSRDNVEIKVLDEGKSGLFGLMGSSPAKVKLIITHETSGKNEGEIHIILDRIQDKITKIINFMELDITPKIKYSDETIVVDLSGKDSSIAIGKSGQTLDAFELILRLIVAKEEKTRLNIIVDAEQYRERREDRLKIMAHSIASDVKKYGRQKDIRRLSAEERKIIHLTLERDPDVQTISKGTGSDRYIVIMPTKPKGTFR